MRIGRTLLAFGATAALVLGMAGCTQGTGASSQSSNSVSMSVNEAQGEASQAIVLAVEDGSALFADKDNGSVYFPTIPEGELIGLDGEPITVDQLKPGNIVEVVGNGIMLESYPGQYPGITLITVVEEGTEANIDPYRDVIDQLFVEQDPYEVPSGHVDYKTPQASTSVNLPAVTWEWDTADGFRMVQDGSVFNVDGTLGENAPDIRIAEATEVTVGFMVKAMDVQAYAQPLATDANGSLVLADPDATAATCEVTPTADGLFTFTAQPNTFYTVYGFFDNGTATYDFYAA